MKTSSGFLWQLIHSLSSSEKLYFKRNFTITHQGTGKLYIKLFDAIVAQKKYDEAAILKKFNPDLNKKNISFQKHYLQQLVCEALVEYEGRNSISTEIFNQVLLIRIYRKKGLLNEAHNTWKKAVKRAQQTESYSLLNLLRSEFEKMILFSSTDTRYEELYRLLKSDVAGQSDFTELILLRDIYAETILLKRKTHFDLDSSLKEKLTGLLKRVENCRGAANSPSFLFRHYYYINKATLLYLLQDIAGSDILLRRLWELWKANPLFLKTNGEHYVEMMYMINYTGVFLAEYDYVTQLFNNSFNDLITEPLQRANFEAIKYLALNKIYNKTARYEEVDKLVRFMKAKYQQWEPLLNSDLNQTVNLSLGIGNFVLEKYDDALYFTKRATTYFKDGTREELASVAHILLLLITYSLNNDRLFDAQYRTTYTYFHKRKKKHPFETALVRCLHRSFYLHDSKSKTQEYQQALQVFEENKDDVVQQMTFMIFNYPAWLQSKAERIPYRHFIERKVKAGIVS